MTWDRWFREPKASELAAIREQSRKKHRILYDCMNAKVSGAIVGCSKGHGLPKTAIALLTVLSGRSCQMCQRCEDYDGEVAE